MMAITLACDRHHSNECFRSHDFAVCRINVALEGVMEQCLPGEPKGWRKLQAMAQKERDPKKVAAIKAYGISASEPSWLTVTVSSR